MVLSWNRSVQQQILAVISHSHSFVYILPLGIELEKAVHYFVTDDIMIRYSIEADGELVIPKVSQLQHEGHYTCRKNVPGEAQEDYASYLRIACKLKLKLSNYGRNNLFFKLLLFFF